MPHSRPASHPSEAMQDGKVGGGGGRGGAGGAGGGGGLGGPIGARVHPTRTYRSYVEVAPPNVV